MERTMETTIFLGIYRSYVEDNGKHGNYLYLLVLKGEWGSEYRDYYGVWG